MLESVAGGWAFRASREAAEACGRLFERPVQRGHLAGGAGDAGDRRVPRAVHAAGDRADPRRRGRLGRGRSGRAWADHRGGARRRRRRRGQVPDDADVRARLRAREPVAACRGSTISPATWTSSASGCTPSRNSAPPRTCPRDSPSDMSLASRREPASASVAAIVAIAFADSSIVVLGLPQLYTQFDTSIIGVSWIVTSYNAAVAVTALALVFFVHRLRARLVFGVGVSLFLAATIACAASRRACAFLIAARSVQGVGAGLLLAGALAARHGGGLDARGHVRRRARAGARRRGDAAVRLARDLRRSGARRRARARRRLPA